MFQTTKHLYCTVQMSGHVFLVLKVSLLSPPTIFLLYLNYFRQCGIFVFHFISYYVHPICTKIWYIFLIKCSFLYERVGIRKKVNNFWDLRFGKREGVSFPRVHMTVADRSEHQYKIICGLHDQLLLSIEKVKIVVNFTSYFLNGLQEKIHIHI